MQVQGLSQSDWPAQMSPGLRLATILAPAYRLFRIFTVSQDENEGSV